MSVNLLRSSRRRFIRLTAAAAASTALLPSSTFAQSAWPSRPVTLIVPYGPGASNDIFTRALANIWSKRFGVPFVVENRPGAGGYTGTNSVVQAAPDGYTFLEMPSGIAGFAPVMKVKFDPLTDLTPISLFARSPAAMVIPASLPVKTVQEFVDYAKTRPDRVFFGYAGVGTAQHQHGEMFRRVTGLKLKGVNYKSSADAQTDLVAGRLQLMFVTVASTLGQIQGGQLRLLGYADNNYPPTSLPAPTIAEAGVNGMQKAQTWWSFYGPARLPADIQMKMNEAVNEALKDPEFVALLAKSGATPTPGSPAQLTQTLTQEIADILEFIKTADMTQ
jgi:tripartite-type tricarboxylate transporter receptor subunit TctC